MYTILFFICRMTIVYKWRKSPIYENNLTIMGNIAKFFLPACPPTWFFPILGVFQINEEL